MYKQTTYQKSGGQLGIISTVVLISTISFATLFQSCKSNLDQDFSKENEALKAQYKSQWETFVHEHSRILSDERMVKSMDSITELYLVTKNKELAVKYIETESGIKRLNFLKTYFPKNEIKVLLQKVPSTLHSDTNYVSLQKYSSEK